MQQAETMFDIDGLTGRQIDVLEAVLRLLVERGGALTMDAVARRASCSKETLYKWFGGRQGLLTATVRWQASKVRVSLPAREQLDVASLKASLEAFARDWLQVISSDTSVALNRVAIAHAGADKDSLGAIVLENGRFAIGRRLQPLLETARQKRLLDFEDADTAFRTFFGLVLRDVQTRLLLGERLRLDADRIAADASRATMQFLILHGVPNGTEGPSS